MVVRDTLFWHKADVSGCQGYSIFNLTSVSPEKHKQGLRSGGFLRLLRQVTSARSSCQRTLCGGSNITCNLGDLADCEYFQFSHQNICIRHSHYTNNVYVYWQTCYKNFGFTYHVTIISKPCQHSERYIHSFLSIEKKTDMSGHVFTESLF